MISWSYFCVLSCVVCFFLLTITSEGYEDDNYESSFPDTCSELSCPPKYPCCDSSQLPITFSRFRDTDTLLSFYSDKNPTLSSSLSIASAPELPLTALEDPRAVCLPENFTCCFNSNRKTLGGCPPEKSVCCLWQLDTGYAAYGCCKDSCSKVPGWCDGPISAGSKNAVSSVLLGVVVVVFAVFSLFM